MINLELRKCDFCLLEKPVLMRTKTGRIIKKICLECHTRRESVGKQHDRNFGTHEPEQ